MAAVEVDFLVNATVGRVSLQQQNCSVRLCSGWFRLFRDGHHSIHLPESQKN